jgi:prefoldin subunit 5
MNEDRRAYMIGSEIEKTVQGIIDSYEQELAYVNREIERLNGVIANLREEISELDEENADLRAEAENPQPLERDPR